jgi:hypothetical protein
VPVESQIVEASEDAPLLSLLLSVSQFNREYSRLFGQPPMRDVKMLRDNKVVDLNAA